MTADMARGPSAGQRLRDAAPAVHRVVAPAARMAARSLALVRQAREAAAFRASLDAAMIPAAPEGSPRVLLDGCAFQDPHSGIARLWDSILAEWSLSGFSRHVVVLDRQGSAPRHAGFTYLPAPGLRAHNSASTQRMLDAACVATDADVFVSTEYTSVSVRPSVLYVYDMTPEVLGWDLREPVWREKHAAIDEATAIVCLSQNTERDLIRLRPQVRGVSRSVALPGVGTSFGPAPATAVHGLVDSLGLPEKYFVFLGHRDHYKNADLLFDAVAGLPAESGFGLLLVGGRPELEPHFAEKSTSVTVRIARLSDDDLRAAYSGATALVYVSRYEGFGLPILEAMACGCPVITCDNSSLPEAAGDAALIVDQDDANELRAAMLRVGEPEIRADLIARGTAWASGFRWSRTAAEVEDMIREVAR